MTISSPIKDTDSKKIKKKKKTVGYVGLSQSQEATNIPLPI